MQSNRACVFLASGMGSGFAPFLSGSVGSAALIAVWMVTFAQGWYSDPGSFWLIVFGLSAVGLLATHVCVKGVSAVDAQGNPKKVDPSYIVIDEWVGMLITIYGLLPHEYLKIFLAFVLFRAFDIVKPGPIRWLERLPREWGIMADDVAAGFLALMVRLLCGI